MTLPTLSSAAEIALLAQTAKSQAELVDGATRLCMRLVDADRAVFIDLRDAAVTPVGFDAEALARYHSLQSLMPSVAGDLERAFRAVATDRLYVEDELYSERDRRKLRVFAEITRPQRNYTNAGVALSWRGQPAAVLLLQRVGTGGARFTRESLAPVVEQLPMLSLAWAAASGQAGLPPVGAAVALSVREREICRYVARGLHNAEIAQLLGTSPNTVRNQLVTLFKKVEVTTRTELAIWYENTLAGADASNTPPLGPRVIDTLAGHSARALRRR